MADRRRRRVDALPVLALLLAAALAVVVLPSVLRPPPEQASASSAFSPDAPPDEQPDTIIQSLRQAASRTAGATGGTGVAAATTVPTIAKPSRGQCFGDPPRQVESIYAAPCRAAFVGDNGGSTHRNVSATELRIGLGHGLVNLSEGPIADTPPPGEEASRRTLRVLQAYFNKNYELYGRRLQFVWLRPADDEEPSHRATAVRADEEWHVFASVYLSTPFCDEMARRTLITFCDNLDADFYEPRDPYVWSLMPDLQTTDRLAAEYVCKKLVGRTAKHAGDAAFQQMERRIGVLNEADQVVSGDHSAGEIASIIRDECGYEVVITIDYNLRDESGQAALATSVAQLRANDVTTVYHSGRGGNWSIVTALADSNSYYPEWFQPGQYAIDWNSFAQLYPRTQSAHLFGLGVHEMARPLDETDCYRAYRSIDPTSAPDRTTCLLFFADMMAIFNGIQEAGPNLTPETFRQGLYSMGKRLYRDVPWAMGGGFGPGDWTYIDTAGEIWWDPDEIDPEQGRPGAWRWTQNGRRFLKGEFTTDEPTIFAEGISRPPPRR